MSSIKVAGERVSSGAQGRGQWLAYGALVIAIAGIAWSAIFIRWSAVPGPSSAFYRVFIASLVLVPWWTLRQLASGSQTRVRLRQGYGETPPELEERRRGLTRRSVLLALGGGIFFGLDLALYNTAVMKTTATMATLLGNNSPIIVGIGSWLLFKRKLGRRFWIGLTLAMTGCAGVMIATASNGPNGGDLVGDFMALGAAFFFAGYLLATERVREEMDTLTFSTIAIVGSVVTILIVCLILGVPLSGFSGRTWAALLGLGLISQLGAYLGLAYALGHLPATITSVGLLSQVPLTAILAVPLLGEPLTVPYLIGGALVLTGIYIVNSK